MIITSKVLLADFQMVNLTQWAKYFTRIIQV